MGKDQGSEDFMGFGLPCEILGFKYIFLIFQ